MADTASSAARLCPTCGSTYPAQERFCHKDGSALLAAPGADLVGSVIAERYHVLKKLGEGGMGQVFLAEHVKMGRKSAVKLMNPGLDQDADAISRFNREAANASRINHPNVAAIYDFGETSDGMIFLAMEFVDGEPLTALLARNGSLPAARVAEIVRQVAEGLTAAHELGIVHRDLKPDNIMIAAGRAGADLAKVVDFGIARATGAAEQRVTRTGMSIGTPDYMSPEQFAGDDVQHTSDIYSLAIVACAALTGKLPFQAASAHELLMMRFTADPLTLAQLRPESPWNSAVLQTMARALSRRSEDRYQSAAEFAADLVVAVQAMEQRSSEATHLFQPSPPLAVAKPRRRTARLALWGGTTSLLAVAAWLWLRPGTITPASNSIAVLPFETVGSDTALAYFGEGIADVLSTALAKVPGLQLAARSSAGAFLGKTASLADIGKALGVAWVLQGKVQSLGDSLRVSIELTNVALNKAEWKDDLRREHKDLFKAQDDVASEIFKRLHTTLANGGSMTIPASARGTQSAEAYDNYLRGYFEYSRRGARVPKAIEYFNLAIATDSSFARAWAGLGLSLAASTVYSNVDVSDVLPRALQAAERAATLSPKLAEAQMAQGLVHSYAQRWAQGEASYLRAILLDSTLALARMHYGRLLFTVGRTDEALVQLERGKQFDPLNANLVATLASAYWRSGRGAEAEQMARRAFDLDSTVNAARTQLLLILVSNGKKGEADTLADRLLKYAGTDIVVRGQIAYAFARLGDKARALEIIAALEKSGDSRADLALTRAYLGLRDTTKALAAMVRVVASGRPFAISQEFRNDPFDPVRGSAKYDELLRAMGLDPSKLRRVGRL